MAAVVIIVTAVASIFTGGAASALAPVLIGEFFGAIGGAAGGAISGSGIGKGALIGAVVGGITGGMSPPGVSSSVSSTVSKEATTIFAKQVINEVTTWSLSSGVTYSITSQVVQSTTISAWSAVVSSGVGAGASVINGMVSTAYAAENNGEKREGLYRGYSGIVTNNDFHEGFQIISNDKSISGRWEFDVYPRTPLVKADAARGKFVMGTWYERTESFDTLKLISNNLDVMKAAQRDVQAQLGKIKIYNVYGIPNNCRTETNRLINRAKMAGNQ